MPRPLGFHTQKRRGVWLPCGGGAVCLQRQTEGVYGRSVPTILRDAFPWGKVAGIIIPAG